MCCGVPLMSLMSWRLVELRLRQLPGWSRGICASRVCGVGNCIYSLLLPQPRLGTDFEGFQSAVLGMKAV